MKLRDLGVRRNKAFEIYVVPADDFPLPADRCDEVTELRDAGRSNKLLNCGLLAADEIELAHHTIAKLHANAAYEPCMTILLAIRAINAKLALCNGSAVDRERVVYGIIVGSGTTC